MGLFEPIKICGRVGDVEGARGRNQDSQSHRNLHPSSKYGELILLVSDLRSKKDSELMDVAFQTLEYSVYGKAIKENFRVKSGETLYQKLDSWKVSFLTGRHSFLEGIKKEIIKNHNTFHSFGGKTIDVSSALRMYRPSFRTAPFNLDEMIAIGGIQEIEVNSGGLQDEPGYEYWDNKGHIHTKRHTIRVSFNMLFKDWFGVDEGDFTNFRPAALLDRRGLAALWILQHQRGYRPFINVFEYRVSMTIDLDIW